MSEDTLQRARRWLGYGAAPIPVQYASKACVLKDWPNLDIGESNVEQYFNGKPQNLGIRWGKPSNGLIDIDLDCPEAVAMADTFLTPTIAFGHQAAKRSHRIYRCTDDISTSKYQYKDHGVLLELRSTGTYTIVPGSIHPEHGLIEQQGNAKQFTEISADDIRAKAGTLAAAALLSRLWPTFKGSRHDVVLHLSGWLRHSGWRPTAIADFVNAILVPANDNEIKDRQKAVLYTVSGKRKVTGLPTLAKVIGDDLAGTLKAWLPIKNAIHIGDNADSEQVRELADLSPVAYDRQREAAAKSLGIRRATLDRLVKDAVTEDDGNEQGDDVEFPPDVAATDVDGDQLLCELCDLFREYLVLPEHGPETLALWVIHTYVLDAGRVAPFLVLQSPQKRCGKTTAMTMLLRLVYRALPTSNITPAALFRSISKWKPTLLIDEADTFVRGDEELRGILNCGHSRELAYIIRSTGEDNEPKRFSTWCPKALALIGDLPETIVDRAITVPMMRKALHETVKPFDADAIADDSVELRSRLLGWAAENESSVRASKPLLPPFLHDRAKDNWGVLAAIADVVGGTWPEDVRAAAVAFTDVSGDGTTLLIQLLTDIRDVFTTMGTDALHSEKLVEQLIALDESPWGEFNRGKSITKNRLGRMLRRFSSSTKAKQIRIDGVNRYGYERKQFEDVFMRYLPSPINNGD